MLSAGLAAVTMRAYDVATGFETFEGGFPSVYWFAGDSNANSGLDYWNDSSARVYQGNVSVWCAGTGAHDPGLYDNDMDAYMYIECQYSGATASGTDILRFRAWQDIEPGGLDFLRVKVEGFISQPYHGTGTPNITRTVDYDFDLTLWTECVVTLGSAFDPCNYVRVTFLFHSDGSMRYEGTYIDAIDFHATGAIYPIQNGFAAAPKSFISNNQSCNFTYNQDAYWGCIIDYTSGTGTTETSLSGFQTKNRTLAFTAQASSVHVAYVYSSTNGRYVQAMAYRKPWL